MSWRKQSKTALFPDLHWSRPVNKAQAGRILLIGGSSHGFSLVNRAQQATLGYGIGEVRAVVPDSLKKYLSTATDTEFVASTPAGSLANDSFDAIKAYMQWPDSTWLVGDFGKNSQTAMLIDEIMSISEARIIVSSDTVDYYLQDPRMLLERPNTLLIVDFKQLQKLTAGILPVPLLSTMGVVQLAPLLEELSSSAMAHVVLTLEDQYLVAVNGEVISSRTVLDEPCSALAVWWTQFPNKPLEALATALISD